MEISIESELERFNKFINEENNNDIIFSGKFGIGKSYFINQFFNEHHKDSFLQIYISPVNYSVASNEDIFEYIKLNILFDLLQNVDCDLEKLEINFSVYTQFYIMKNIDTFFVNALIIAEKINYGTGIIKMLLKLKKGLNEKVNSDKKLIENDELKTIQDFTASISSAKGSIFENDIITNLIRSIISSYKISNPTKKVVLFKFRM